MVEVVGEYTRPYAILHLGNVYSVTKIILMIVMSLVPLSIHNVRESFVLFFNSLLFSAIPKTIIS